MAAELTPHGDVPLEWTGERYLPEVGGEIGLEHTHRYLLARALAAGRDVLDIACGEGYGSAILAATARSVVGVDIDETAVGHARARYPRQNLRFQPGRADRIPLADASVDLIVSFETLEHHDAHDAMLQECRRVLRPGGLLCISSPDRYEYSERPGTTNPYHVRELSRSEFEQLLRRHFRHVRMFGQRVRCGSFVGPADAQPGAMRSFEAADGAIEETEGLGRPLYLIAYASDTPIADPVASGMFFSESVHPQHEAVGALTALVGERDRQLDAMRAVAERNRDEAAAYRGAAEDAARRAADSEAARAAEREAALAAQRQLGDSVTALQRLVDEKERIATALRTEVSELRTSTSWRITAPLRTLSRAASQPLGAVRALRRRAGGTARAVYRRLPVSESVRRGLKDAVYARTGFLLAGSASYRAWVAQRTPEAPIETPAPVLGGPTEAAEVASKDDYRAMVDYARASRRRRIESLETRPVPLLDFDETQARARAKALSFDEHESPTVSIVVPVYGKVAMTVECLESVRRARTEASYEVIVVDDGSPDATGELLPGIAGLRYARNPSNLGFVRTCNHGASLARGRFLVFLNNDAQVSDGWLDALLGVLESTPDAGAVGPRIVYPNGRLQEAGTVLNRDASATLIGLADDPNAPAYAATREVDYCSGACLMLRADLFRRIGGFDLRLAPSYCEDVDLCLKVRAEGLRVLYVADARIAHHLSVTSNELHSRYKRWWGTRNQQQLAERWQPTLDAMNEVRLITFYLPQFHAIPENDKWWGRGFTEWTNVTRARPNFVGHTQPLLPADLGYYDLRTPGVMQAQADLAKRYGIHGFCYYYYWFGGKRLLETPLEAMLASGSPDMPFCLCWANENWTRRWDGQDAEVLIGQQHSPEDDEAVIADLIRYMRDPRYIRMKGKPVLLVYRINAFPDIASTARRWRAACLASGLGEITLLSVESHDAAGRSIDPRTFGFDGAIEFPPHQMGVQAPVPPLLNPNFTGQVYDYPAVARKYIDREWPGYPFWRGVIPRWDNTARRQDRGGVFVGSSPGAYQGWLETVVERTREMHHGDERVVFINAWNEWAEGAHLEPDTTFGHAYLEATRNALDAHLLTRR
ncbi:MAG: glycoside hydrolase family 99-like domain-containing protein [Burkholderiales bacterium]